jgi:RNA polymerase sigma-70 factor (ECF subfamily)
LGKRVLPHEQALRCWLAAKRLWQIDIDDVVQETYAVLAALEDYRSIVNPKAYAFTTALSIVKAQMRRSKIVAFIGVDDIADFAEVDARPSPETEVSDREQLRRLAVAIAALPPRCREVFVLRKVEGLAQREVADRLGISEGTVEKHMQKGLLSIAATFGRGGTVSCHASMDCDGQRSRERHGNAKERDRGGNRDPGGRLGRSN